MKNLLLAIVLLTGICHPVSTSSQVIDLDGSTTRAVVIGISNYNLLPDLQFADRDAMAFADYLLSPAGGSLPAKNVHLLTNEKATTAQVGRALEWLIEACKEGDQAIIYFSGHGDVETKTMFNRGYLLTYDSPPVSYYAGAFPIGYLQDVISTLSERNKAQVIVITDACRAGKLAGNDIHGAQITAANLQQKVGNEIKILSCQPDEYSIEGTQWGGGRGAFSYHLVEGLTGLADRDHDLEVKLMEIDAYLKDIVPKETAPNPQIPNSVGNLKSTIARVDETSLAVLLERKSREQQQLQPIATKGFESEFLAKADTSIQELYAAFEAAIEKRNLLTPVGASANDYYEKLVQEDSLAPLHGYMKHNLAAALQDEAQVVINQLLLTDPQIVDDAFSPVARYDHLPAYLARAAELLGERHFMYRFLKAKEYYFRSKTYRKERFLEVSPDSLLRLQLASLDTALGFDSMAAYVFFEKGYLQFWGMEGYPKVFLENFEKAIALSPEWVLPNYYAGRTLTYDLQDKRGISFLKKVIALDSTFLPAYRELGGGVEPPEGHKFWKETYIQRMKDYMQKHPSMVPVAYYNYLGNVLTFLGRHKEALEVLLEGERLSKGHFPLIYSNLCPAFGNLGRFEDAEKAALKLIQFMPNSANGYYMLAYTRTFYLKKPLDVVFDTWKKAQKIGPYAALSVIVADAYRYLNHPDSAEQVLIKLLSHFPRNFEGIQHLAELYRSQGMVKKANEQFQKLLNASKNDSLVGELWHPDYYFRIIAGIQLKSNEDFEAMLLQIQAQTNSPPDFYFQTASAFAFFHRDEQALNWLEGAFQHGFPGNETSIFWALSTPDFYHLNETPAFQSLVKKYLPDYYKD